MERWRSYFGKANADIWTVIEQAINVAAMDHPKDFKEKRSEIAETLFARNLVQMHSEIVGLSGSVGGVADDDQPSLMEEGEVRDDEEERTRAVAPSDGSHRLRGSYDEEEALTYEADQETILLQELDRIKQIIEENDQPENVLLGTLQKLEDMQITVNALKVTEIGKQVNSLRKHSSKHVRAIVKRLVKHWKFLVDQWVKVAGDVPAAATAADALAVSECRDIPEAGNRLWGSHSSPVNDALPLMTARTPSVELSELFSFIDDEMCGHAKNKEELEPSIKDSMYHSSRSQSGSVLTDSSDCDAKLSTNQTWGLRTPGEMGSATRDNHTSERMEKGPESVLRGLTYQCYTDHKELNHLSGLPVSKALAKNSGSASRPLSDMSKVRVTSGSTITVRSANDLSNLNKNHNAQKTVAPHLTGSNKNSKPSMANMPDKTPVDQKLEIAKRKLHQGYQQAENAKKQRTVQVLDFPDLPKTVDVCGKANLSVQSKAGSHGGHWSQNRRYG